MSDKYKITLLASKTALAELIATGLEKHATITGIEAVDAPRPAPEIVPVQSIKPVPRVRASSVQCVSTRVEPMRKSKGGYQKRISGWEVYEAIIDLYHPQKPFTSGDLFNKLRQQFSLTRKSASAHLHRFVAVGLIRRVGGDQYFGWEYETNPPVRKKEFQVATRSYNRANREKERARSRTANLVRNIRVN